MGGQESNGRAGFRPVGNTGASIGWAEGTARCLVLYSIVESYIGRNLEDEVGLSDGSEAEQRNKWSEFEKHIFNKRV